MFDLLGKLASNNGLLGLLLAISFVAIGILWVENKRLNAAVVDQANKRVEDLKAAQAAYATLSESATKVAENTYTIVQNLQQLLNSMKRA